MPNTHFKEALLLLSRDETGRSAYETEDAQHIVTHIEANTQATLALAEEQRTANLITMLDRTPSAESRHILHDTIIERLGLNSEAPAATPEPPRLDHTVIAALLDRFGGEIALSWHDIRRFEGRGYLEFAEPELMRVRYTLMPEQADA